MAKHLENDGEMMDIVEEGAAHRDVQVLHVVKGERRFA
jgi:hypothetical protein